MNLKASPEGEGFKPIAGTMTIHLADLRSSLLASTLATAVTVALSPGVAPASAYQIVAEVPVETPDQEVKAATFDPVNGKSMAIYRDDDGDGFVSAPLHLTSATTGAWVWRGKAHLSLILLAPTAPPMGASAIVPIFEDSGLTLFTETDDSIFRDAPPLFTQGQTFEAIAGSISAWPGVAILNGADADLDAVIPPAQSMLLGYTGTIRVVGFIRLTVVPEPSTACLAILACTGAFGIYRRRQFGADKAMVRPTLIAAIVACTVGSAHAGVENKVILDPSGSGVVANTTSASSVAESGTFINEPRFWESNYLGSAGVGTLGASVQAFVTGPGEFSGTNAHGGAATAHFRIDDLVISNIDNPGDASPILVSMNFRLDGSFAFSGTLTDKPNLNRAGVRVRDYSAFGFIQDSGFYNIYGGPEEDVFAGGIFASLGRTEFISGDFATPPRTFQVGVPQVFGLELIASASTNTSMAEPRFSRADFANTLAFAPGMPVFNLPAGYTANSVGGHVVNNVFLPPAVPEPSGCVLACVLALAARRFCS